MDLEEGGGVVTVTVRGPDLGLLIGKHGQTIDAIQYLANAILHRRERGAGGGRDRCGGISQAPRADAARRRRARCRRGAAHRRAGARSSR